VKTKRNELKINLNELAKSYGIDYLEEAVILPITIGRDVTLVIAGQRVE
jgi:hypothetical protein